MEKNNFLSIKVNILSRSYLYFQIKEIAIVPEYFIHAHAHTRSSCTHFFLTSTLICCLCHREDGRDSCIFYHRPWRGDPVLVRHIQRRRAHRPTYEDYNSSHIATKAEKKINYTIEEILVAKFMFTIEYILWFAQNIKTSALLWAELGINTDWLTKTQRKTCLFFLYSIRQEHFISQFMGETCGVALHRYFSYTIPFCRPLRRPVFRAVVSRDKSFRCTWRWPLSAG